jgi:D-3-phosphoglycerate dehydrogenase
MPETPAASAPSRPHFVLTARIHDDGLRPLAAAGTVTVLTGLPPEKVREALATADAIIARTETVDAAMMDAAPRARIIVRHGVGYDNIDVKAASARGIPVAFLPGINAPAVAEHVFGLLFALTKKMGPWNAIPPKDRVWKIRYEWVGVELDGKTLGIVGLGNIGRMVAKRAAAFGMRLIGYDPMVTAEQAAAMGIERREIDALLAEADVITLHVPDTPETRNLMNAERLARLKPSAFLINTARGTLVDLDALDAALRAGKLAGAGLDVFPVEPPDFGHPIWTNPRLVATPHVASHTAETTAKTAAASAKAAIEAVAGTKPTAAALADPAAWPPKR